jgi:asparagine synthetase A
MMESQFEAATARRRHQYVFVKTVPGSVGGGIGMPAAFMTL